ncbi:MAG: pyridoxamine 5'-phosphate oxidase [Verrucomicrobiota bacterium]|nr:pyridoxamine 5'-phosphate oxidase [Verrucomicrobiota bacterium]
MPLSPDELAALRQDYALRGLRRAELDPDPIAQFNSWLNEAAEQRLLEPNAMILATVDAESQPWSRTVLLKLCDARGFSFFTNYHGAKARHLDFDPRAALTFWWAALERQVNITGTVSRVSREESERYFHSRPVASQLAAWASQQSGVIADRAELERNFGEAKAKFGEPNIPLPPFWGGYRLSPRTIEFWQGRHSRLHDRFRYSLEPAGGWKVERLSP